MKRVTGIGGIFFKAKDSKALKEWYEKHLGIPCVKDGYYAFQWGEPGTANATGSTVWSIFSGDTKYMDPGTASFMINYRVENLDALLDVLRKEGVKVDEKVEDFDYGKFGWIYDPEGNKIELWEPKG
jgi:predicted enzyme related to lactoylglutathione lyase